MNSTDFIKRLKSLFLENLVIKLFSVLFAVMLWVHVAARGETEVNFAVPLELCDIPEDAMVVGEVPDYVDVRLQGQEGMIRSVMVKDISASVSLADARLGENVVALSASNVQVRGNVKVKSVSPSRFTLRLEKLARKEVPVKAEVSGRPAPGYRLARVEVSPGDVEVQGPENSVKRVGHVSTGKIDVQGADGSFDRVVRLMTPPYYGVRLDEDDAHVAVTIVKTKKAGGR